MIPALVETIGEPREFNRIVGVIERWRRICCSSKIVFGTCRADWMFPIGVQISVVKFSGQFDNLLD